MDGLLHLVQRGGDWAGSGPPRPLIAVPNVTAHRSTACVPITVLLYDGPLLCGFNVAIKGLTRPPVRHWRQTTAVVNRVLRSEPVVNSHRRLRWHHLCYDAKVQQKERQLLFAVTIFVFVLQAIALSTTSPPNIFRSENLEIWIKLKWNVDKHLASTELFVISYYVSFRNTSSLPSLQFRSSY